MIASVAARGSSGHPCEAPVYWRLRRRIRAEEPAMGQQPAERYTPLSETELDEWEARARGDGLLPGDPVLRLIAEVRRLRRRSGATHITRTPGRCGGAPTLAGTRIGVADIVALARRYDWDLERLRTQEFPQLSAAEVEAAISY